MKNQSYTAEKANIKLAYLQIKTSAHQSILYQRKYSSNLKTKEWQKQF